MLRFCGTTAVEEEIEITTEVISMWNKALQLKDGPLELSFILNDVPTFSNKCTQS